MYCIVLVSEQKDMIIDRKRQKRAVMIRLENVCFAYEKEIALRYVDLHINRGDSIVIQDFFLPILPFLFQPVDRQDLHPESEIFSLL